MNKKIANVLVSCNHGIMIVNRFDYNHREDIGDYGIGYSILNQSAFEPDDVKLTLEILSNRRREFGDGVVALDIGANIGTHTVEWAKFMNGWGSVLAFEAQERVFYSLVGNIAINNCFNARGEYKAIGKEPGTIKIPQPDYFTPSSFGSFEIQQRPTNEFIGQSIDFSEDKLVEVQMVSIDALNLNRVDFIKIDIEGMEMDALEGSVNTIKKFKPILFIEKIKSDEVVLKTWLEEMGYQVSVVDINFLAVPA